MSKKEFDVCVIGAGPGGYVAAIKAAQRGADVAIIEKGPVGGTCLNIGCVPTKSLIAGAEAMRSARQAADFGVAISGAVKPDWAKMLKRKNAIVEKLRGGVEGLLKNPGITSFHGTASFVDRKTIHVKMRGRKTEKVTAAKFIIATGSKPLVPSFIPQSKRILTSTELLEVKDIPKSLLILGGGVIGCEFACLFNELGTKVTVVEMMPSILPNIDKECSRLLTRNMRDAGVNVLTGAPMGNIKATAKTVSGEVKGKKITGDLLLVSIGRAPVSAELNLPAAGVRTDDKGWIPVDPKCRTNAPGVYAIGDVTGTIWQLAHFASAQGVSAAENATGGRVEFEDDLVPGCIFTHPEIATVGLSSEQCGERKLKVKRGKFPFAALGKAMAVNDTEGFCKILADPETDLILGVHVVGPHATDLISEAVAAMKLEATAKELGRAIHPHPTLGEVVMEAAHAVHDESVHVKSRKR